MSQKGEKIPILRNPLTVKQMPAQIKYACDMYDTFKLSEKELQELLVHYAGSHGRKFFCLNGGLNPTLSKIIGKKREELVRIMHGCTLFFCSGTDKGFVFFYVKLTGA
jgi:uncharacterized protein (TIGR04540 family)